jgi:hypothetical protein
MMRKRLCFFLSTIFDEVAKYFSKNFAASKEISAFSISKFFPLPQCLYSLLL